VTINKSQGQTMDFVGVNCIDPCFTHGQTYVAASRVGCQSRVRFLIEHDRELGFVTRNVVYTEALQ